jgi:hypothetical protein
MRGLERELNGWERYWRRARGAGYECSVPVTVMSLRDEWSEWRNPESNVDECGQTVGMIIPLTCKAH